MSELLVTLREHGQEHLAERIARLNGDCRDVLLREVGSIDIELVERLYASVGRGGSAEPAEVALEPPHVVTLTEDNDLRIRDAIAAGEAFLASGRVALVLLAGGQGTRLGFDGPKGEFPFLPVTGRSLFWHYAATIKALRRRYGAALPWYVLTSPANDARTRAVFRDNDDFDLGVDGVRFVVQGVLPAVDLATGGILLRTPCQVALSPDGHGGLLAALRSDGAFATLESEGVDTLFTFQVDNPLTRVADPCLVGLHLLAEAEMSSIVIRKQRPDEQLALVARTDGKTRLVEYSDVPVAVTERREPDGDLTFWAGSINVHCIDRAFAQRVVSDGALPYHRAIKSVPYVTPEDDIVSPTVPNAVKFETFIFDALPAAATSVMVEARRSDVFSPIKNRVGANSPETCRRDMNRRNRQWLLDAGVRVPVDHNGDPIHDIEIDPCFALDADEVAQRLPAGLPVDGDVVLGRELV